MCMTGSSRRQSPCRGVMKMERKALFLDMDGTTLNDDVQIPKENYEAMEAAKKAGHEIVITTGRPLASARILLKKWDLERIGLRYVIAFNGGMVLDTWSGEILYQKTLTLNQMRKAVQASHERKIYIQTYEGDKVLTEDAEAEGLVHYIHKNGMQHKLVNDLFTDMNEEACKMLAIDIHHPEYLEPLKAELESWQEEPMDLYLSCKEYMEIMPKGVSKGNALKAFCKGQGIPLANTLSAGDEYNDISMIQMAGIGCAVANARPDVKAVADYVTKHDNNHGAIREIIEKFML